MGDAVRAVVKNENGYLIVSSTHSNDGDISGYHGDRDLWIFNVDEAGNITWQKCFGGTSTDIVNGASVVQAQDQSFSIATETTSTDGDITNNNGQADIRVLHIDKTGNLLTQKTIGGAGNNYAQAIKETGAGKLYILGSTNSANLPNYHVYGSVYNNVGNYTDVFLTRLENTGAVIWQKCFGGNLDDKPVSVTSKQFVISVTAQMAEQTELKIFDLSGKLVLVQQCSLQKGRNIITVNQTNGMSPGMYTVSLMVHKKAYNQKIVYAPN